MKTYPTLLSLFLIFVAAAFAPLQQELVAAPQDDDIVRVAVETTDGKVAWSEIAAAVTKELAELEVPEMEHLAAGGVLDINASSTRLILYSANKLLLPAVRISINRKDNTVVVRLNKTKIEAARKQWGANLRAQANEADAAAGRVNGLRPYRESTDLNKADSIVVLVHGFNSSTRFMGTLANRIEKVEPEKGKRCEVACFDYASRDGIRLAAKSLEQELQKLVKANPECEISLVTHSMGGVVSRWMIEDKDFDIPQVKRLTMVAPPNHGTNLALLPTQAGQFDSFLGEISRAGIQSSLRALAAEVNVAIEDLRPDSELLKTLNQRKRNATITYSIILGKTGILSREDRKFLDSLVDKMNESGQKERVQASKELSSLMNLVSPEIVSDTGDGVVSLESGKLDGVEDVVVLKFQHSDLLKDKAKPQSRIVREILKRLKSQFEL